MGGGEADAAGAGHIAAVPRRADAAGAPRPPAAVLHGAVLPLLREDSGRPHRLKSLSFGAWVESHGMASKRIKGM